MQLLVPCCISPLARAHARFPGQPSLSLDRDCREPPTGMQSLKLDRSLVQSVVRRARVCVRIEAKPCDGHTAGRGVCHQPALMHRKPFY
eukprot:2474730-Pleurochrysis_carterae.AAC.2